MNLTIGFVTPRDRQEMYRVRHLCHLPVAWPDAATLIALLGADAVYVRDAGPMGASLGDRAMRIAVKDAGTNRGVLGCLEQTAGSGETRPAS